jgi:competence protein ComEA
LTLWDAPARRALLRLGCAALAGLGLALSRLGPGPGPVVAAASRRHDAALERARRVDVNAADAATLERLPGIGPSLARRIVDERQRRGPFASSEDLARVRGIGMGTIEAIQDYVAVR